MSWLSKVGGLSQMVETHHQMLLRGAAGQTPESSAAYYPGVGHADPGVSTQTAHTNPQRVRR
ncbi:hypothetical protein RND64_02905 [Gordonia sp. w5E2]|uniref:Uncharacterized protein n=1 Tax=Gordonia jacobaea TaxID=122202 RepID=A0ABR5IGJ5_9ACTN|nr:MULTISPECIES: hypothetical protein [Gordonia]KNA92800.1 hypothetical protein ABW18_03140 [Gordonia jacobaea]SKY63146.1 Uncharacterised protein [Mycobacteroides abscessus subsp. abscessus]